MNRSALIAGLAISMFIHAHAQCPSPAVRLWAGDAPGARGQTTNDIPSLTPWLLPGPGPHPAIVVLPGGGYGALAQHEGAGYAAWLQTNGLAAFVVKYRLGTHGYRQMRWLHVRGVLERPPAP